MNDVTSSICPKCGRAIDPVTRVCGCAGSVERGEENSAVISNTEHDGVRNKSSLERRKEFREREKGNERRREKK